MNSTGQPVDVVASPPGIDAAAQPVSGLIRGAMLWNLLSFVASQGAGIVIFLLIATRLPPQIFGVVALAALVADFVAVDGRYAAMDAVMQAGRYDRASLNSSFFGFFVLAATVALGMALCAPWVASAYHSPLLAAFMPLFGLMLLPIPWLAVMDALMMHKLQFRQFTQRNIVGTFVGGVVGVGLAFSPWFVWALIGQRCATLVVAALLEYRYSRWVPTLSLHWPSAIDFIRRFFALWVIGALNLLVGRFTMLLFGVRYDTLTVGLARAANRMVESVQGPIVSPMMGLWFPLMSKVKADLVAEREVYNSILRTSAFLCWPAFAGLAVISEDLVRLILPPQYLGSAPILAATSITFMLVPISWFNAIALSSLGMNKMSLGYTLAFVITSLAALLAFRDVTPSQALLIMSAPCILVGIVGAIILNRRLGQSNREHYQGLAPAFFATLAMSAAAFATNRLLVEWNSLSRLCASVAVGAVVYGGWLWLFHRAWMLERFKLLRGRNRAAPLG